MQDIKTIVNLHKNTAKSKPLEQIIPFGFIWIFISLVNINGVKRKSWTLLLHTIKTAFHKEKNLPELHFGTHSIWMNSVECIMYNIRSHNNMISFIMRVLEVLFLQTKSFNCYKKPNNWFQINIKRESSTTMKTDC